MEGDPAGIAFRSTAHFQGGTGSTPQSEKAPQLRATGDPGASGAEQRGSEGQSQRAAEADSR